MADSVGNDIPKSIDENNEDESIITMVDVLEEEKQLEEDAFAVLGAADDKNCTYDQGYVKRQALYACKTCFDNNKKLAGICLACSYHCHEGHDLIELYTKRNFKCDCGNTLFGEKKCNLQPDKESVNGNNNYNQNFKGVYCTCARPYPDPDDNTLDEMIQCIVCEDWYHTRHLSGSSIPGVDEYSEMICHFCTARLSSSFLSYYKGYSVIKVKSEASADSDQEVVVHSVSELNTSTDAVTGGDKIKSEQNVNLKNEENSPGPVTASNTPTSKVADANGSTDDVLSVNDNMECKLKSFDKITNELSGASFWRDGFRKVLCRCDQCLDLYKSHGVSFLVDPSDTVQAYEEEGEMRRNKSRTGPGSGYEQGLQALSTLDRVKQVEAIHSYNEMQQHLKAYLAKFAENKKVVRAEDIREFFSEMQSRKRQKVEVPYFCH